MKTIGLLLSVFFLSFSSNGQCKDVKLPLYLADEDKGDHENVEHHDHDSNDNHHDHDDDNDHHHHEDDGHRDHDHDDDEHWWNRKS
jgi:hypothetical protein